MKDTRPLVEALEEEARAQLSEIRAFRTYRGSDPDYRQRAKLAIGVIGSYVRLRATMANDRSNELIALRLGAATLTSLPEASSDALP